MAQASVGAADVERLGPLVKAEAADDPDAFARLCRTYHQPLLRYFQRRINIASEAEDLVQETFARLAKPGRIEGIGNLEAYIFQAAANLLRERARRRATAKADQQAELHESLQDDQVFSPERILLGKEALDRMATGLKELPERVRTIFVLQRFEGFGYAEIARKLGVSQSTVEKAMSRAIAHLAKCVAGEHD